MELSDAIKALAAAGATITIAQPPRRTLTLDAAGELLSVSTDWLRAHMREFPHAYRLPGGGRNGGEWRIPLRDLDAFEKRRVDHG